MDLHHSTDAGISGILSIQFSGGSCRIHDLGPPRELLHKASFVTFVDFSVIWQLCVFAHFYRLGVDTKGVSLDVQSANAFGNWRVQGIGCVGKYNVWNQINYVNTCCFMLKY